MHATRWHSDGCRRRFVENHTFFFSAFTSASHQMSPSATDESFSYHYQTIVCLAEWGMVWRMRPTVLSGKVTKTLILPSVVGLRHLIGQTPRS